MTDKLVPLVKAFEGKRLQAYRCPAGVWTIGYGHTSAAGEPAVREGMVITEDQADLILRRDLEAVRLEVAKLCAKAKGGVAEEEIDAFTSLAFNIGTGAFRKSTALRKYLRGDKQGAADAILAWNKASVNGSHVVVAGLTRRRQAERKLFLEGHAAAAAHVADLDFGTMPQAVAKPALRKPIQQSTTAHAAAGTMAGGGLFAFEGAKQALGVMSDAKDQATQAAGLFGVPAEQTILVGGGILIMLSGAVIIWRRYRRSIEDLVIDLSEGLHIPGVAELLGRGEDEAEHVEADVKSEVAPVEAEAEHVEGVVEAAAEPVVAEVAKVAEPVVQAVEPVAVKVETASVEAVKAAVAEISPVPAPAPAPEAAAPAPAPVVAAPVARIPTLALRT